MSLKKNMQWLAAALAPPEGAPPMCQPAMVLNKNTKTARLQVPIHNTYNNLVITLRSLNVWCPSRAMSAVLDVSGNIITIARPLKIAGVVYPAHWAILAFNNTRMQGDKLASILAAAARAQEFRDNGDTAHQAVYKLRGKHEMPMPMDEALTAYAMELYTDPNNDMFYLDADSSKDLYFVTELSGYEVWNMLCFARDKTAPIGEAVYQSQGPNPAPCTSNPSMFSLMGDTIYSTPMPLGEDDEAAHFVKKVRSRLVWLPTSYPFYIFGPAAATVVDDNNDDDDDAMDESPASPHYSPASPQYQPASPQYEPSLSSQHEPPASPQHAPAPANPAQPLAEVLQLDVNDIDDISHLYEFQRAHAAMAPRASWFHGFPPNSSRVVAKECQICLEEAMADPYIAPCGHVACRMCWEAVLGSTKRCYACTHPLRGDDFNKFISANLA
jgi:hypothetical protein